MTALSELLWQARSGASVSIALPPTQERGSALAHEQLMRGCTFVSVTSKEALQVRGLAPSCTLPMIMPAGVFTASLHLLHSVEALLGSFLEGDG